MPALASLDDPGAGDPAIAGGKAARLARARALGLPVLPGVVVPAELGRGPLARGARALRTGGSGAARLAVMRTPIEEGLLDALARRVRPFGSRLIVRSSSALEHAGVWAGAFSTFEDVGVDELAVALRGVWASAFSVDALRRFERTGRDPDAAVLAVLVQPQLSSEAGGTARSRPDGSVQVGATRGPLAGLLGGWEAGVQAAVSRWGTITGDEALAQLGEDLLLEVAGLARRVRELLGDDTVEWACAGAGVTLLQSTAVRPRHAALGGAPTVAAPAGTCPRAVALALAAARFPGPLAEELVLPWVAAATSRPRIEHLPPSQDPVGDLRRASVIAAELTGHAWQVRPARARREVAGVLHTLLGADPDRAGELLAALRPVPAERGQAVLELLDAVGRAAAASGHLAGAAGLWRLTLAQAVAVLSREPQGTHEARATPGRWEPFAFATITAWGRQVATGAGAAPGAGVGTAALVTGAHDLPQVAARDVVVAARPLPALAPLLWSASGLVTTNGNPAAHLLAVADSLGVPAVVGADLDSALPGWADLARRRALVAAVDGERGRVTLAPT